MEYKDLDLLSKRIYTGLSIVNYEDKFFFISDPKPRDQLLANIQYEKYYEKLVNNGVATKDQIQANIMSRGIWTSDLEDELDELAETIEALQEELKKYEFQRFKKLAVKNKISEKTYRKEKLESMIRRPLTYSAEQLAENYQNKYLLYLNIRDEHNRPLWDSFSDFQRDMSESLCIYLLKHSFYDNRLTEPNIRLVARKDPWRSIWLSSVKTGNLFESSKSAMTDFQRVLVTWSIAYDNVYEHPESPGDDIVNDDALLDEWFTEQNKKQKNQKSKEGLMKKITNNPKIQNAKDVGIVVDSIEEAERVYELNDKITLNTLRSRDKVIKDRGSVKEGHMPDTKIDLQMRKNRLEKEYRTNT